MNIPDGCSPPRARLTKRGGFPAPGVPGFLGVGKLTLGFSEGGEERSVEYKTFSVAPPRPPQSSIRAFVESSPDATGYSIDLTPLAEPTKTFYAALRWDAAYAGLQRTGSRYDRQLQFAVWDEPEGPATIEDAGDGVFCGRFGGEGVGVKCETDYPWAVGGTYRFEMTEEVSDGVSLFSLQVTDLGSGESRYIGTLRFGRKADLYWFATFVEDFERSQPTCLDQPVRSAAVRRAMARTPNGEWVPIVRATLDPQPEDSANPGTPPCANVERRCAATPGGAQSHHGWHEHERSERTERRPDPGSRAASRRARLAASLTKTCSYSGSISSG